MAVYTQPCQVMHIRLIGQMVHVKLDVIKPMGAPSPKNEPPELSFTRAEWRELGWSIGDEIEMIFQKSGVHAHTG